MTTVVVHGTMTTSPAQVHGWWWNSYERPGFLWALRQGLDDGGGVDDVWEVGGTDVQDLAAFTSTRAFANHAGRFLWSSFDQGAFRRGAGKELAGYLDELAVLLERDR